MKKAIIALCLFLPVAIAANSQAQRKNNTVKDIPNAVEAQPACNCKANDAGCKCMQNMKQDMPNKKMHNKKFMKKNSEKWLEKQKSEINEDYNEAIEKINASSFPVDYKKILEKQAQSNKDLAIKQATAVSAQLKSNWDERQNYWKDHQKEQMEAMDKKQNRKACKEVDDIIK